VVVVEVENSQFYGTTNMHLFFHLIKM
jgi:hypothetical protein